MAYTYRTIELPSSKYSLKCPNPMTAKYLVIHNTDNNAPAINEIKYMQSNNSSTSFHIAVDESEAIQGLPLDRNAWHAGDGSGTNSGNRNGIAIEICRSTSDNETFKKAQDNAILLVASMLKERNWGIDKVKKHQDFSGKNCPKRTLSDYGWQWFLDRVQGVLEGINSMPIGENSMRYFKLKEEMNMRSAPNGNLICVIPKDTVISGSVLIGNGSTQWLNTSYNGKTGYVCVLPASKNYAEEVEAPKQRNFTCYVDSAINGVFGWCYDGISDKGYELHLYIDKADGGRFGIPKIMANEYREDVKKAGFGNGYSAFKYSNDKLYELVGEGNLKAELFAITDDGTNPSVWKGSIEVKKPVQKEETSKKEESTAEKQVEEINYKEICEEQKRTLEEIAAELVTAKQTITELENTNSLINDKLCENAEIIDALKLILSKIK